MRRILVGAAVVAATVALAGCQFSVGTGKSGTPAVGRAELEQSLKQADAARVSAVSCEGDLQATVGASQRCTVTFTDGRKVPGSVKVTSVEGTRAKYDFRPDAAAGASGSAGAAPSAS